MLQDKANQARDIEPNLNINLFWLIEHADNLLDDDSRMKCHEIRLLRNNYIHYENIIAHLGYMEHVEHPMIMKLIREKYGNDIEIMKQISIMENALEEKKNDGMLGIRFKHLEKKDNLLFINKRYYEYIKWFSSVVSLKTDGITERERETIYTHEAFDARECLSWAFEVNKKLGFIKT